VLLLAGVEDPDEVVAPPALAFAVLPLSDSPPASALPVLPLSPLSPPPPLGVAQLCVLHACDEFPAQAAPPPDGAGAVQERVCVPPPHVAEHAEKADQPPATARVNVEEQVAPDRVYESVIIPVEGSRARVCVSVAGLYATYDHALF